ncbi:MAG: alpha/beta hydrolase [Ekhidna sp.]
MNLYAISGLGADERVFQYLSLKAEIVPIKWLQPDRSEGIDSYAKRMAQIIDTSEPFGLIGVSFGGLICVEICKFLMPEITILISTVEKSKELPVLYRIIGRIKIIKLLPSKFFRIPKRVAHFLFGSINTKLLDDILFDSDPKFTKWALSRLLVWESNFKIPYVLKVGGLDDKLLPPKDSSNTTVIDSGGHFMIVDKADEISQIINEKLRDLPHAN